jgi:phosphatidylglycerol lysyltransferase
MGRLWHRLSPLVGLLLFAAALWVLSREVRHLSLHGLWASIRALPSASLLLAIAFTVLNYAILTGYDQLAFVYIRRPMPRWQISVASFVGYAIANNVGFALLSGTSARYRFYSRWGLSGQDLSRVVVFYSGTFWLGLVVLGAWTLLFSPVRDASLAPSAIVRGAGVLLALTATAYAVAAVVWKRPLRLFTVELALPSVPLVAAQYVLSALDWGLGAGVLFVLLPEPRPEYSYFLGAFLAAQIIALVSHVPGGIGVFESLMILLLKPWLTADELLPALAAYRAIYYLVPLVLALGVLVVDEAKQRRHQVVRWGNAFGTLTASLAPKLLAVFTLLAGAVLMFSGATPAATDRVRWLARFLPLPLLEVSHFAGSLVGFGLLVVSWGLARRLNAAYHLAIAGLAAGIAASLLKGGDYEEALALGALLLVVVPSRQEFDRRSALFEVPFSTTWLTAVSAVVLASVSLGLFAFRHVDYTHDLWWTFAFDQDAPRFLRATIGVLVAMLAIGLRQLLRPPAPEIELPSPAQIDAATAIALDQERTGGHLVALGDKAIRWSADGSAFLMFAVQGRTWVVLGDPVGRREAGEALVEEFLEHVDDYQGIPVFYEASRDWLHRYADFGLTFAKLGENARVPLAGFALEGGAGQTLRTTERRVARERCTFRVLEPAAVTPDVLEALRRVSNDWLTDRNAAEKGFSLGYFDPAYLSRFPVAVMERDGRVEAFASLWPSTRRVELSMDLMRHRTAAPPGTMDALIIEVMRWGHEAGYQWVSLGMAPLSGLEESPAAPLWAKLGRFVYGYGETFYDFKELRAYREKFDPEWEPRYLAYPGGLALPRVLADVSALIAGGYRRIFTVR